ncbi:FAD-dependent oxidoreductase [Dermatophilaceae bacterium Sec6.4]
MTSPANAASPVTDTGTMTAQWVSDDVMRPDRQPWDLLVIGGGTAGLVAAQTASSLGASVLMVERARTGGDCLWTGCVPSKALLAAAHAAADARDAARFGIRIDGVRVNFAEVMAHVHDAIVAVEPNDAPDTVRSAGVQVAHGAAVFTGADRVRFTANEGGACQTVRFRHCVVATGSQPRMPDVPGLADAAPLTSETVWGLRKLPRRLLVIGGGTIGCELGQAFARLGSRVTILESADRLLGPEDERSTRIVQESLVRDGVRVLTGMSLERIEAGVDVHRADLAGGRSVDFDVVLVATGRAPRSVGLGLQAAGVDTDQGGHVIVDKHLRTGNPRIYAAGDVTAHPKFTHVAGVHGSLAGSNSVLGIPRSVPAGAPPRVTFTQPELAAFGVAPAAAADDASLTVQVITHDVVDRAVAEKRTAGLTQIVLDKRGKIVGASIVSPRAGESLAELVIAARGGLGARDVASAMHAYPTLNDAISNAAIAQVRRQLGATPVRLVTRALAAIQRRRS